MKQYVCKGQCRHVQNKRGYFSGIGSLYSIRFSVSNTHVSHVSITDAFQHQTFAVFRYDIQVVYLPVAHLQLLSRDGDEVEDWLNVEPYLEGDFIKLTNNLKFCNSQGRTLATALTHFTHTVSEGNNYNRSCLAFFFVFRYLFAFV